DRALQMSPSHPRAQIGKARALVALAREGRGDPAEARALLEPVVQAPDAEMTPALRARALAVRADARLLQGDAAGAWQDAQAALAIDPKLSLALKARALASLARPDHAGAAAYLRPGRIAEKKREFKTAAQSYARASQLRDDLPEPYARMGSLYLATRQVTEAIRVFNEALARYRATHAPPGVMEAFYEDVHS